MKTKRYHFIGIGGIGMSGLARILLDQQQCVSGSDLSANEAIQQLIHKGASVSKGHAATHIEAEDIVIYNSQIQKNNPEYLAALSLKCPLMHRSDLLAHLMEGYQTLAVAGTHGKTTTSALLSTVLLEGGWDPTFAIGGMCGGLNGKWGKGRFFVAEADESDGTFLKYHPQGAIITNIEPEHLDHYKSLENLKRAFQTFFSQVSNEELLFYCGDDPILHALPHKKGVSYGFKKGCDLHISNFQQQGWTLQFDLSLNGKNYPKIGIPLVGEHNALNAAAVFGLSLKLGIPEEVIRKAFLAFRGVGRRCEKRGNSVASSFLMIMVTTRRRLRPH